MKTKYQWHVLYTPKSDATLTELTGWQIIEFSDPEEAADKLFAFWDEGHSDAHIIPVLS